MSGGAGSTYGKYFLLNKLAIGGMGEIFLAKLKGPVGFEKLLVLKRMLAHHVENQEFVDMFFAEARVAAGLSHSNIVQIYEMGEIEDAYYIAMEYVHGKSLREIIDRARARGEYLPPSLVINIVSKMCDGMSYAHNATNMSGDAIGIIHRDLNPHNVLVSYSGEIKIIDFGIAKTEIAQHETEAGTIKGKFVYMSPEQSAAQRLDKRSDLFSIGICLYEALTLFNPFAKANVVMSLDAIQRQDPAPVSQTSPKLAPFDPVISKALAKNRDERYDDGSDLRDALQRVRMSGDVAKSHLSLTQYMRDLFEETIKQEKQMILDSDSASPSQVEQMKKWLEHEHQSGSHGSYRTGSRAAKIDSQVAAMAQPRPHSRLPFWMALLVILVGSGVAAGLVYKEVLKQRRQSLSQELVAGLTAAPAKAARPPEPDAAAPKPAEPKAPPTTAEPAASAKPTAADRPTVASAPTTKTERPGKRRHKRGRREREVASVTRKTEEAVAPDAPAAPAPPSVTPPKTEKKPPPPPPPPADPVLGTMAISTVPPVKIYRAGRAGAQTFKIKRGTGTVTIGDGGNTESDPFQVHIRYKIDGDQITYTVKSEPWAIVKNKDGIGLGKTPLPPQKGGPSTVFQMVNPRGGQLRVTLRFTP